jgi:hypothetical protein
MRIEVWVRLVDRLEDAILPMRGLSAAGSVLAVLAVACGGVAARVLQAPAGRMVLLAAVAAVAAYHAGERVHRRLAARVASRRASA